MSDLLLPPIDPDDEGVEFVDAPDASDDQAITASSNSVFERLGLTNRDVVLLFASVLLTSVYLPMFSSWSWTPRMMVLIVSASVGGVALVDLARRGDRAAWWGGAALVWSVVAAFASEETLLSLKGHVLHEATVLTTMGAIGCWALARGMSSAGRRLLVSCFVGAVALNVAVAVLQVVAQIKTGDLALGGTRATGLTPNSGHLGAYTAAAAAIGVHFFARATTLRRSLTWGVSLTFFAVGLALSGSRVALGAIVVVAAWVVVRDRCLRTLGGPAFVLIGVLIGSWIARTAGSDDSLSRSGQLRSGGRGEMWSTGWAAFTERPITGWGFGRFRTATQGRWSIDFVVSSGDTQQTMDAHNLVVTLLVAVGLPGLLLFAGFVLQFLRSARGPLALATAAISMTWLLQPAGVATLPIAMLLFGASAVPIGGITSEDNDVRQDLSSTGKSWTAAFAVATILGLAGATYLGVADVRFANATATMRTDSLDSAAPMFGADPVVRFNVARAWGVRAGVDPSVASVAVDRAEATVAAEPLRAFWWTQLAQLQGQAGQVDDAVVSARTALSLQPTAIDAWSILAIAADDLGDVDMAVEAADALCRLDSEQCVEA